MDKVAKRSKLSEGSSPMVEPLVNLLQYSGTTTFTNQVLLVEAPQIKGIHEYTQLYLDQLVSIKGLLPDDPQPIKFPDYISEVKKLREKTSSSPSDVPSAMIKANFEDNYLAQVGWQASNFPWITGYSPDRF
eukprot:14290676-Ditylum_brightwellii.AAC.1